MKYSKVHIESIGYELAPVVVTSEELEDRLAPLYDTFHFSRGQLEALTGIVERRWWEAGRKALAAAGVKPEEVGVLIYGGVNREHYEPATACHVAADLGIRNDAEIYDISNACLGVLNGILDVANRIELGQIDVGMVVSCETAREINDVMIGRMLEERNMEHFTKSLATLTGGSGACAVLMTSAERSSSKGRRLLGGVSKAAPEFHNLCKWGVVEDAEAGLRPFMFTDAVAVLKNGVKLGLDTWESFLVELGWTRETIDKVICHQVGNANRDSILTTIGIPVEKDYSTYPFLGNMGTVSLPMTAALAEERDFLATGDQVAFLGIGSGLNCMMLGVEW